MRRALVLLLTAAAIVAGAGGWMYQRVTERLRVLAAIEAAGGKHQERADEGMLDRFGRWLSRAEPRGGDEAWLRGPEIDDAWLANHNDLRSLSLRELFITDSKLSREAVLRLVSRHRFQSLLVPGIPLTDADAAVLGDQEQLTNLNLMQSEITDAGLPALRPERLIVLNVAGTAVTSAALQQKVGGPELMFIVLDGRQFTPELAAHLAQSKTLRLVSLMGPDVTDAHVKLLESMPNVTSINIDQTSASPEAIAALKAAKPQLEVNVFDAATTFFKWRAD